MKDGFKKGSGCFPCEDCGKLTRQTDNNTMLCRECYDNNERMNDGVKWKMDDYEAQAEKFLISTKTKMIVKFLKHGKHFVDDKETRDIYSITLKKSGREYIFNFGQSIVCSGQYIFYGNEGHERIHLELSKTGKQIKRYKGQYLDGGNSKKNEDFKEPTAYDVLTCLQKYEIGTFEDFCADFGYDEDSRKAEKIYKAVLDEYQNLQRLYSEAELKAMQKIEWGDEIKWLILKESV